MSRSPGLKRAARPPAPKVARTALTTKAARLQQAKAMSEADLQVMVIQLAELKGWLVYHTYNSRRSQPGYPDLTMVRRSRVVFIELKTQSGKRTADQDRWGETLSLSDAEYYLWRPLDWLDGGIASHLA